MGVGWAVRLGTCPVGSCWLAQSQTSTGPRCPPGPKPPSPARARPKMKKQNQNPPWKNTYALGNEPFRISALARTPSGGDADGGKKIFLSQNFRKNDAKAKFLNQLSVSLAETFYATTGTDLLFPVPALRSPKRRGPRNQCVNPRPNSASI